MPRTTTSTCVVIVIRLYHFEWSEGENLLILMARSSFLSISFEPFRQNSLMLMLSVRLTKSRIYVGRGGENAGEIIKVARLILNPSNANILFSFVPIAVMGCRFGPLLVSSLCKFEISSFSPRRHPRVCFKMVSLISDLNSQRGDLTNHFL